MENRVIYIGMEVSLHKFYNLILLSIGVLVLLAFSFQYFFSATVPIGGDAPYHIKISKELPQHPSALKDSTYPLSHTFLSLTKILPLNWEKRFILWMCVGYFFSGILIGLITKKISGALASATAMTFWAVSTWNILPFYRDGTLAQLWSIIFFLLLILLLTYNYNILAGGTAVLIYFCHPATFAIMAVTLALFLPFFLLNKPRFSKLFSISILLLIIISIISFFYFSPKIFPYSSVNESGKYLSLSEFMESRIGIILLLSSFGFIVLSNTKAISQNAKIFIMLIAMTSFFTTFNSLFGAGSWERRFSPYFISTFIIIGSIGTEELLRKIFSSRFLRITVIIAIIAIVCVDGWPSARGMYKIFDGQRSAMHPEEKSSYEWIKNNLQKNSVIALNSTRGRGVEWLPIIAERQTLYLDETKNSLSGSCDSVLKEFLHLDVTHIFFFKWTENIPDVYTQKTNIFKKIYENTEVILFEFPNKNHLSEDTIQELCK